jgi:hypothetical protein
MQITLLMTVRVDSNVTAKLLVTSNAQHSLQTQRQPMTQERSITLYYSP